MSSGGAARLVLAFPARLRVAAAAIGPVVAVLVPILEAAGGDGRRPISVRHPQAAAILLGVGFAVLWCAIAWVLLRQRVEIRGGRVVVVNEVETVAIPCTAVACVRVDDALERLPIGLRARPWAHVVIERADGRRTRCGILRWPPVLRTSAGPSRWNPVRSRHHLIELAAMVEAAIRAEAATAPLSPAARPRA